MVVFCVFLCFFFFALKSFSSLILGLMGQSAFKSKRDCKHQWIYSKCKLPVGVTCELWWTLFFFFLFFFFFFKSVYSTGLLNWHWRKFFGASVLTNSQNPQYIFCAPESETQMPSFGHLENIVTVRTYFFLFVFVFQGTLLTTIWPHSGTCRHFSRHELEQGLQRGSWVPAKGNILHWCCTFHWRAVLQRTLTTSYWKSRLPLGQLVVL